MLDLGRHAHAEFGSREDADYRRLFPKAPSEIAATPERDRKAVFSGFVQAVTANQTPAKLAPFGKEIAGAWKRVQSADGAVGEASERLTAARATEGKVRLAWLGAYRRLHAQLTDRFPHEKKRVERYFRSPAPPKAKKKPAPAPVP